VAASIVGQTIRIVAYCSIVLILGSVVEINAAADVHARQFDEFKGTGWEDAMARLDNFALSLRSNPSEVGIIFVYGGQNRRLGAARAWASCMRDYLQNRRGIEANRIMVIQGGYRNELTVELWQSPDRLDLPKPTPQIKPTEVRFKGRPIKRWRSLCSSP
jgi:hypothetical protein